MTLCFLGLGIKADECGKTAPVCQGQSETDEPAAMFILEDGAKISNAIIGATQAEGIHCRGAWLVFMTLLSRLRP